MSDVFKREVMGEVRPHPEDVESIHDRCNVSIWVRLVCQRVLQARYDQSLPHRTHPDGGQFFPEPWRGHSLRYGARLTRALETASLPPHAVLTDEEWQHECRRLTDKGLIKRIVMSPYPAPWPAGWPVEIPHKPDQDTRRRS